MLYVFDSLIQCFFFLDVFFGTGDPGDLKVEVLFSPLLEMSARIS